MVSKPVSQQTDSPAKATEKTREWMFGNLKQFAAKDVAIFAEAKGWLTPGGPLISWSLDHVPTNRQELSELIREIEQFIASTAPQRDLPFSEPFWDAKITIPRAGMKRSDYVTKMDTIRSLYEAMKSGDDAARKRLYGIAKEWSPSEYTDSSGALHPPNAEDLECRKNLDAFLEFQDRKGERS